MVSMNDKKVRIAVLNHIGYRARGHGGATNIYKQIEKAGEKGVDAVLITNMSKGKMFPANDVTATTYLHKLGFTDKQIAYHGGPVKMYRQLIIDGLINIYLEGPGIVNLRYEDVCRARKR